MHVEPEEANQRARNERADDRKIHLPWRVEECDDHVADPGEGHRPTREAVEAIGEVDAVARRDDGDYSHGDPQDWRDWHLPNKGHNKGVEGEVLL